MDSSSAQTLQEEGPKKWLLKMALFCRELQEFITTVPRDAQLSSYAAMDEDTAARFPYMAAACDPLKQTQYMPGIDSALYRQEIETVYALGVKAYSMVYSHPALGVFQGIPETRIELFFERPLDMCMALGAEHGLCRATGRNVENRSEDKCIA